jgi:hypothetical protein
MSVSLIPDSQGLPLSIDSLFYREADTAYHVQEHSQPLHQWYMCVHGSIAIRLEAGTSILGPGQSILYRPGTLREPRCRGRAPGYLVAIFHNRDLDLDRFAIRSWICLWHCGQNSTRSLQSWCIPQIRIPGICATRSWSDC